MDGINSYDMIDDDTSTYLLTYLCLLHMDRDTYVYPLLTDP